MATATSAPPSPRTFTAFSEITGFLWSVADLRSKQSTNSASISSFNLGEAPMPIPPLDEARAILRYVRASLTALDRLDEQLVDSVERLREYRQALITAGRHG